MDRLTFLGTGDSMGVPRVYCDCSVCAEARSGELNRRTRSSVLLESGGKQLIIDCGPTWGQQMERLRMRDLDHLLITHAHYDHIGGLPEYADLCRWLRKQGNVYAPAEVLQSLRSFFPWLENHLVYHEVDEGHTFGEWKIHPWRVCHGKNGFSYAYRFSKAGYDWVYCPDSIRLNEEEKKPLYHLNLLILGTNFYQEKANPMTRSVYDIVEALELVEEVQPEKVYFTHLSHGIDLAAVADYRLPKQCKLAYEGLQLLLSP
ncbi:MBL fold metallo-hydrolase [Paenibacillus sp. J2TS4]|uniref:MBL fold metallo-hydrolase n=1 Tax=Paenibacillus sp. J2TS4 TaxID=2807194 RepID=UPI001BD14983